MTRISSDKQITPDPVNLTLYSSLSNARGELMGIAAIWIFVFHYWILICYGVPVLQDIEGIIKSSGYSGVDIFFLLSGIGLVVSHQKDQSIGRFYYRRFRRITLVFLLAAVIKAISGKWTLLTFVKAVTGYSFLFEDVHTILWFVPAIMIYYLVFPFYFRLVNRFRDRKMTYAICILASVIVFIAVKAFGTKNLDYLLSRLPVFVLGTVIAFTRDDKKIRLRISHMIICFIGAAIWAFFMYCSMPGSLLSGYAAIVPDYNVLSTLIGITGAFILSYYLNKLSHDGILRKILRLFGSVSLEMYCLQEFIVGGVSRFISILNIDITSRGAKIIINLIFVLACVGVSFAVNRINSLIYKRLDKKLG